MNFQSALADLDSRQPEQMPEPSLDRIRALAELMDHPELTYPSIHITGTNGKTTTAQLVSRLACGHGLTTGTFVSPHISSVTERLTLCADEISVAEFGEEYERILPYLREVDGRGDSRVTYFEALTALGYLWFADKPVSLGVFEVGLGGAWDATNLVRGDVAVLCPIGLDHVGILGDTVEQIALEKAGIVKEGRTAVVRDQRPEALRVIESRAAQVGARLLIEGTDFRVSDRSAGVGGQVVSVDGLHASYDGFFLPLFGEQAARNAAAAIVSVETLLDRHLDEGAVQTALRRATSPGRLEVVGRHPAVVLDGAHNPDAAEALADALRESFRWSRLHLVIGMFDDKDVAGVARILAPLASRAYACATDSPRAARAARVREALAAAGAPEVEEYAGVQEAVQAARDAAKNDDLILVTGSFYTVGEARPLLLSTSRGAP